MNHTVNQDGKTFTIEGYLDADCSEMTTPVLVECLITEHNNSDKVLLNQTYKTDLEVWCK